MSVTVRECVNDPFEAMIVNVKGPVWAVAVALMVSVDVPEPLMLGGLKLPLSPDPKPLALSDTVPGDPLRPAIEIE